MMKGGGELGLRMNNFYVEINSSLMHTMNIPNKFAKMFVASMSENIELEGPSRYTWHVKIMRSQSDNTYALQSGWKEFVTANKIYENDILVFTFKGNSSFKVLIFDRSGCEKVAPFFAKNMNTELGKESTGVIASPHQQESSEGDSKRKKNLMTPEKSNKRKRKIVIEEEEESDDSTDSSDDARSEEEDSAYECPAPEFYNFGNDRSIEKFKPGQTWALYCDTDNLPKYYAVVKQVDPEGKTVYITWLEPYRKDATGEEKRWIDTDLPLGCGTFIFGGTARYNNTDVFSHELVTLPVPGKKNVCEIVPAKTETWAVYKNWKIGWSMNDITKMCQYDLVRVYNVTRSWIEVLYLAKVADHRTVFKLDHDKKVMRIPKGEFGTFSHKIPAHRLSVKAGPNLSGCWELDPAALPESLLF